MMTRPLMNRAVPEWRKPTVTWSRVRVLANCSGFVYRGRDGQMHVGNPGDVVEIDAETRETRRRNIEPA